MTGAKNRHRFVATLYKLGINRAWTCRRKLAGRSAGKATFLSLQTRTG